MADVEALAREIKSAQDTAQAIAPVTSHAADFDVPTAYRVAAAIHRQRVADGARAVGRKIGFTNARVQAQYGVHAPIWGHVYDRTLAYLSPGATFAIGRLSIPRIEPEIAVHFRDAPPADGSLDEILASIDWIAHGLEIVQSPYPEWKFQAADAVAASSMHAALLLGEPRPVAGLGTDVIGALERFSLLLSCDGQLRDSGTGTNVLGHPLAPIAHLAKVLKAQSDSVKAGEVITTGSITAALLIKPGETWTTEISGIALPGMKVRFTD